MSNSAQMQAANPVFSVADVGQTIAWYQEKLGFICDPFPDKEPFVFALMFRDQIEIMLQRIEGFQKPDLYKLRGEGVWDAYIRLQGIKEFFEDLRESVTVIKPLRQQPYGAWEFEVKDP